MTLYSEKNGILTPYNFSYDAVTDNGKRKSPVSVIKSEDKELKPNDRKKLVASIRDQYRNFSLLGWMVRKHLDYTTNFKFVAKTENEKLNTEIENLIRWWSTPDHCDVTERFSLGELVRMAELHRIIDGDFFLLKLRSGKIQGIEGDRIRNDSRETSNLEFNHGVRTDAMGKAVEYAVYSRNNNNYSFEKLIPARNIIPHVYYSRYDQVRGISPLASSYNALQDLYEACSYHLIKSKFEALFGLKITRQLPPDATDFEYNELDEFELNGGVIKLDLEPGCDADLIHSKNPPMEFQNYANMMIRLSMLALDIPYTFLDSRSSSYSAMRQDRTEYIESAKLKQNTVKLLLNRITEHALNTFRLSGVLDVPADIKLNFDWRATGKPMFDPLKDINTDIAAINAGLKTRSQVAAERGLEFKDLIDEIQREQEYMKNAGVLINNDSAMQTIDMIKETIDTTEE